METTGGFAESCRKNLLLFSACRDKNLQISYFGTMHGIHTDTEDPAISSNIFVLIFSDCANFLVLQAFN